MPFSVKFEMFGGINMNDAPDALMLRSHVFANGAWEHRQSQAGLIGMESPSGQNFDIERQRLRKRNGSTSYVDFTSAGLNILLTGDVLVDGIAYRNPTTNARVEVVVSKNTIYTNQSGTFARVNNSAGTAYTHNDQAVTKCSFTLADGHLFIGLDGNNRIQVYRNGANLDAEMWNGNTYTEVVGGGTQTITGTWITGAHLVESVHDRLIFGAGTNTVYFTDSQQPWDLAGGGSRPARARVIALMGHVPQFGDDLNELLYAFTPVGAEFMTGFTASDLFKNIAGAPVPLNDRCMIQTRNWLMYLSEEGGLWAVKGDRVINVGRRLKAQDGTSGPLDTIAASASSAIAFGFYNEAKQQASWAFATGSSSANDTTVVLDFQYGEPFIDEPQESYELHVRCLIWKGINYVGTYQKLGAVIGIRSTGTLWTLESGDNDFGTTAISTTWFSPEFTADVALNEKNWLVDAYQFAKSGAWNVQRDVYLNRGAASSNTAQLDQGSTSSLYGTAVYGSGTYTTSGFIKSTKDVMLYANVLQLRLLEEAASRTFILYAGEIRFNVLGEQR